MSGAQLRAPREQEANEAGSLEIPLSSVERGFEPMPPTQWNNLQNGVISCVKGL